MTRTGRALVSNHGRTLRNSPAQRSAQPFTTGGHAGGYVFRAVQVRLGNPVPSSGDALVRIFSHDGGPDTGLVTLAPPAAFTADAVNTFTAPAGTRLAPDTTYYVVTTNAADTARILRRRDDFERTEDGGAAAGWSIGDGRYTKGSGRRRLAVPHRGGHDRHPGHRRRPPPRTTTRRCAPCRWPRPTVRPSPSRPRRSTAPSPRTPLWPPKTSTRVTLGAAATDANATLAIVGDNDPATPGEAVLALVPGANVLTVAVTAEDGAATAAYTVTVDRAPPPAACPVPNDWCATMTAGHAARTTGTARVEELGHAPRPGRAEPGNLRVQHPGLPGGARGPHRRDRYRRRHGAERRAHPRRRRRPLTEGSVLAVDGAEYTLATPPPPARAWASTGGTSRCTARCRAGPSAARSP